MSPDWRLGRGRADLTPTRPTALAGFSARAAQGPAGEVDSPLTVRAAALRPADDPRPSVIVVADVLCWGADVVATVEGRCAESFGLDPTQLLLHATHTHSAPQTSQLFHPGLGVADPHWVERFVEACVRAIGDAVAGCRLPVTLERSQTTLDLGVDRRHARTGGRHPRVEIDRTLRVVTARTGDGSPALTVLHHACHPTIHHANRVSSEFCGAAMDRLEADGDGLALYLQGCCGNINPDRYVGAEFRAGGADVVAETGHRLAAAVRSAQHERGVTVVPDVARQRSVTTLPTEPAPDAAALTGLADDAHPMVAGWARLLADHPERRASPQLVVSRVRFGPQWELIGLGAEATSSYGDRLRDAGGDAVWPLGYTNGMVGYLVTPRELAEGGYEPDEAPYWFGLPGRLTPAAADVVHRAVTELLGRPSGR